LRNTNDVRVGGTMAGDHARDNEWTKKNLEANKKDVNYGEKISAGKKI
jgi:hypothetical protein